MGVTVTLPKVLTNRKGEVGIGEKGKWEADRIQMRFILLIDLSIFKVVQLLNNCCLLIAYYLNDCNSIAQCVTRVCLGKKRDFVLDCSVRRNRPYQHLTISLKEGSL